MEHVQEVRGVVLAAAVDSLIFCFLKKSVIFVSWAAPGNPGNLSEEKRARSASLLVRALSARPGAAQISKMTGC
jgi:hypothetical protein